MDGPSSWITGEKNHPEKRGKIGDFWLIFTWKFGGFMESNLTVADFSDGLVKNHQLNNERYLYKLVQ